MECEKNHSTTKTDPFHQIQTFIYPKIPIWGKTGNTTILDFFWRFLKWRKYPETKQSKNYGLLLLPFEIHLKQLNWINWDPFFKHWKKIKKPASKFWPKFTIFSIRWFTRASMCTLGINSRCYLRVWLELKCQLTESVSNYAKILCTNTCCYVML